MAEKKKGRVYYYRMRTPEKRLEANVKIAAMVAVAVVVGLIAAFGLAFFFGAPPEEVPVASAPPAEIPADEPPTLTLPEAPAEPPAPAPQGGPAMRRDCADCPPLVVVPAGSFSMGIRADDARSGAVSPSIVASEAPAHGVTFQKPFALQQTEVTRRQFDAFVKDSGHQAAGCTVFNGTDWVFDLGKSWRDPGFYQDQEHPVVCISRADAQAYVDWLSAKAGVAYRLPSESEWEYAARAGLTGAYVWGNDLTAACGHANVAGSTFVSRYKGRPTSMIFACDARHAETSPVAQYKINAFGLYDMYGNVRELTADCWNNGYRDVSQDGAARMTGDCGAAVSRGGGWFDPPVNLRTTRRLRADAGERRADQGFRVARDLDEPGF
jgi:sulfatase modifying factor 1